VSDEEKSADKELGEGEPPLPLKLLPIVLTLTLTFTLGALNDEGLPTTAAGEPLAPLSTGLPAFVLPVPTVDALAGCISPSPPDSNVDGENGAGASLNAFMLLPVMPLCDGSSLNGLSVMSERLASNADTLPLALKLDAVTLPPGLEPTTAPAPLPLVDVDALLDVERNAVLIISGRLSCELDGEPVLPPTADVVSALSTVVPVL